MSGEISKGFRFGCGLLLSLLAAWLLLSFLAQTWYTVFTAWPRKPAPYQESAPLDPRTPAAPQKNVPMAWPRNPAPPQGNPPMSRPPFPQQNPPATGLPGSRTQPEIDQIHPVPFTEIGGTGKWSSDQRSATYDACGLALTYEWHQSSLQLPIAASFTPPAFPACVGIQLSAPWMTVLVEWEASRFGQAPVAPDPRPPSGSNFILKRYRFGGKAPELSGDSSNYMYRVAGAYEYFVSVPLSPDANYELGALPTQTGPIYVYSAAQFRTTIFQLV